MSPTPDEVTSPKAENLQTFFSNSARNFSSSTDFSKWNPIHSFQSTHSPLGEKIVEEVSQPEPKEEDPDESFLFGQDLLETVLHPAAEERQESESLLILIVLCIAGMDSDGKDG